MLLVILLPLLNFSLIGCLGFLIGSRGVSLLSIFILFISNIILWCNFYDILIDHNYIWIDLNKWIESGLLNINKGFLFDSLSFSMSAVILFISLLIHLYSIEYMKDDPHLPRFMSFLSIFTFFMLVLITSNNFIQMFIGWEGVGLCSFLLINFWFTRINANKAAMKAIIVNRVGDFGVTLGICLIFCIYKTINFPTLFSLVSPHSLNKILFLNSYYLPLDVICFLLFVGSIGKSAQLGLHIWLPDAMEGPTPVSALIHAATMVTAGVFLIIRTSILFEYAPNVLLFVTLVGGLTCFFAAVSGLLQHDLKKVIAYSTCSQLGYMIFSCGLSNYTVSFFHLVNHAFFKALLFLSAGALIHSLHDEQDIRKMGGLIYNLPLTYFLFMVGSLSLCGFPFLSGFYSKDLILEVAFQNYTITSQFIFWLGSLSALLTSFYTFRVIYFIFIQRTNAFKSIFLRVSDVSFIMSLSLISLSFNSIFGGLFLFDMFLGLGSTFWGNSIFILPQNFNLHVIEFVPTYIKLIPIFFSLLSIFFVFYLYETKKNILIFMKLKHSHSYNFILSKWYFDKIINYYILQKILFFGHYITFKLFDKGLYEMLGPNGITNFCLNFSTEISRKIQNGRLYTFLILIFSFFFLYLVLIFELLWHSFINFELFFLFFTISVYELYSNSLNK